MAFKKITSFFALTISTTMATVAVAAIHPANADIQVSFAECSLSCQEFSQIDECQKFRRDNQLCVEKKKSVWPRYSAAVLEELEC